MANMTKTNIEEAIRQYLQNHLELIPQIEREQLRDVTIKEICMVVNANEHFSYEGKKTYNFVGKGECWVYDDLQNKTRHLFDINNAYAEISGDENPVVESIQASVLLSRH